MEWWLALVFIFGGLLILLATGLPVAFSFLGIILIGTYFFWGGEKGLIILFYTQFRALASYSLLPVAMFIFMGEIIFQTGIGNNLIDALDKWIGRIRARLSVLALVSGTGLSVLTGTSMATIGLLGSTLVPEMERRGYKRPLTLGPILGSSGLATVIPPSAMAVILAYVAQISVAKVLIGGVLPGLIMAGLYGGYIFLRCWLQPEMAPAYEAPQTTLKEKLRYGLKYIIPLGLVVFLVTGTIIFGIATPSEASATGAFGCFLLAIAYRKMNWENLKRVLMGTTKIVIMAFFVISTSIAFSQMLAFSGASRGLMDIALSLPKSPILFVISMQFIILLLGMFMDSLAIVMITVPIFFPIIIRMGFNPVWFAIMMLINLEMSPTTPPYGIALFILKGVAPPGTSMGDIYKAAIPFLLCDVIVIILLLLFPDMPLWLSTKMGIG